MRRCCAAGYSCFKGGDLNGYTYAAIIDSGLCLLGELRLYIILGVGSYLCDFCPGCTVQRGLHFSDYFAVQLIIIRSCGDGNFLTGQSVFFSAALSLHGEDCLTVCALVRRCCAAGYSCFKGGDINSYTYAAIIDSGLCLLKELRLYIILGVSGFLCDFRPGCTVQRSGGCLDGFHIRIHGNGNLRHSTGSGSRLGTGGCLVGVGNHYVVVGIAQCIGCGGVCSTSSNGYATLVAGGGVLEPLIAESTAIGYGCGYRQRSCFRTHKIGCAGRICTDDRLHCIHLGGGSLAGDACGTGKRDRQKIIFLAFANVGVVVRTVVHQDDVRLTRFLKSSVPDGIRGKLRTGNYRQTVGQDRGKVLVIHFYRFLTCIDRHLSRLRIDIQCFLICAYPASGSHTGVECPLIQWLVVLIKNLTERMEIR